jgi:hypothetical protein
MKERKHVPTKKKKPQVVEVPKKKFLCEGVDRRGVNLQTYAKKVEDVLNQMNDRGYQVQLFELQEKGTFILGKLPEEEQPQTPTGSQFLIPLSALGGVAGASTLGIHFKSTHSHQILRTLLLEADHHPVEKHKQMLEIMVDKILADMGAEDANKVIEDIELTANNHAEIHKSKGEESCPTDTLLREFSQMLKEKLQLRMQ